MRPRVVLSAAFATLALLLIGGCSGGVVYSSSASCPEGYAFAEGSCVAVSPEFVSDEEATAPRCPPRGGDEESEFYDQASAEMAPAAMLLREDGYAVIHEYTAGILPPECIEIVRIWVNAEDDSAFIQISSLGVTAQNLLRDGFWITCPLKPGDSYRVEPDLRTYTAKQLLAAGCVTVAE